MNNLLVTYSKKIFHFIESTLINFQRFTKFLLNYWQRLPRLLMAGKTWKIIELYEMPKSELIFNIKGNNEKLYYPNICNVTDGGYFKIKTTGLKIYRFVDASFAMDSDFIRSTKAGSVVNYKIHKKEYECARQADRDLLKLNQKSCKLKKYRKIKNFENVYHITGSYFGQWAHFMGQFYPKLALLPELDGISNIKILIPKYLDSHIKYLIENVISKFQNIQLVEVGLDEEFHCSNIYYPIVDTHISDIGLNNSPFHIKISDSTVKFWLSSTQNIRRDGLIQFRKLYIGRGSNRGIINGDKIRSIFLSMGYEECFPHMLDIHDKIKLFSEAKYIAGPMSSGFVNAIFSQKHTKILMFSNYSRSDDMFLTKLAAFKNFDLRIFAGIQKYPEDANSSFSINVEELTRFIADSDFFREQTEILRLI